MPYATRRKSRALNRAYAQVIAKSFTDAAGALVDKMVGGMGFNPIDAATVLMPDAGDWFGEGGGDSPPVPREPIFGLHCQLPQRPRWRGIPILLCRHLMTRVA